MKLELTDIKLNNLGIKMLSKCKFYNLEDLIIYKFNIKNKGFNYLVKSNWPKMKHFCITI